ncbi:MAG: hypothetical protein ACI8TA_002560 [Cyclobacteriaceae bacterium]|jgi:hypothetical protein
MNEPYLDFTNKLKKLFGKFDEVHKRFEKSSNTEIARELGYSDAQFSRLINDTATEGEYVRANQNADRILSLIKLREKIDQHERNTSSGSSLLLKIVVVLFIVIFGIVIGYFLTTKKINKSDEAALKYDMLRWSFETPFVNPYTKLKELPSDCDYPCYKYQGKWQLKNEYKLPFFRERNGFHYLATDVIMYARCMSERSENGNVIEGYEYQRHEIWYDTREIPIDSFLLGNTDLRKFYMDMDFKKDENFVKIATIHTFYREEFRIDSAEIHRSGRDIGRDIEFISQDVLSEILPDQNVIADLVNEINMITRDPLNDFSKPSACNPAIVPDLDFHQVSAGDEMSFDCKMTTSRVTLNYTKTFVLKDQYIKNICRNISE